MAVIEARGLRKRYGRTVALDGLDLTIGEGRIVGLIGRNGAGKTTALNAVLGLIAYEGELRVLGRDPWSERNRLMREVAFIADVAVLPRWLRVSQALDLMAGVHPGFDRAKAESLLARTTIGRERRVRELSKGMIVQLHLALVLAIDAKLLVLDEPTLGLDLIYRRQFFATLLSDYLDRETTVVLATHEVDAIQDVLTDVVFVDAGRVVLSASVDELAARWREVVVRPERLEAARALGPRHERSSLGRTVLLFEGVERARLDELGEVRTPSVAELFVALVGVHPADGEVAA